MNDLPLVLQDRQFDQGRLIVPDGMMTLMHGRRGDTLLVNGARAPQARVAAGLVRLRLINGSNARTWELAFEDGHAFHWIASEGGLLAAPVRLTTLWLAPAERAEVVVDFADGRERTLITGLGPERACDDDAPARTVPGQRDGAEVPSRACTTSAGVLPAAGAPPRRLHQDTGGPCL